MRANAGLARRGRMALWFAALTCLLVGVVFGATPLTPSGAATITESNACLGVTGTFATFEIPISGTASPDPVVAGSPVTLSGVSIAVSVDAALIGAGVATGLVPGE